MSLELENIVSVINKCLIYLVRGNKTSKVITLEVNKHHCYWESSKQVLGFTPYNPLSI